MVTLRDMLTLVRFVGTNFNMRVANDITNLYICTPYANGVDILITLEKHDELRLCLIQKFLFV